MRRIRMLLLGLVGSSALVLLGVSQSAHAEPVCGPGAHWVDNCPSGIDEFPSLGFHGIDQNLDGIADDTLSFAGPTVIFRGEGSPHRIGTELVSAVLVGNGKTLVAGDGRLPNGSPVRNFLLDPTLFSPGEIVEQPNNPTLADSRFNVFFELQTPAGPLRAKEPQTGQHVAATMEEVIDRVPPIDPNDPMRFQYRCQNCPLRLFDFGPDGVFSTADDVHRANLVEAVHIPTPEPSTVLLLGSGLAGLGYRQFRRLKKT